MNGNQTITSAGAKRKPLLSGRKAEMLRSPTFWGGIGWKIFRFVLLLGLTYMILLPFFSKIASAFMSQSDLYDSMVKFIPRNPTLENILFVFDYVNYPEGFLNSLWFSTACALLGVLSACLTGYGLAAFKFRGRGILFALVVLTMVIPPQTIQISSFIKFKYFDILGIIQLLTGSPLALNNSPLPMILLALTGFGIKNGLYIFIMRQFFTTLPAELSEAAEVDGASTARTFFQIILPTARPLGMTIFLLAFSWQWLDIYYAATFYPQFNFLATSVGKIANSMTDSFGQLYDHSAKQSMIINTNLLLIILPLMVLYLVAQKQFIQGVERSGIVG
ncbi:MAG: carbohydrate ABC transporter permease [Oscillospiraceae bacterium]|nr:carbohydrate ABC transporter permease [Oscillospiraceae bacterium]